MSSAVNVCKQFEPRSGPTNVGPDMDSYCFTLMIFLKVFFEKVDFEKNQQTTKALFLGMNGVCILAYTSHNLVYMVVA